MMESWSFVLAVFCLNFIVTNGEEQIQQVIAELRNQTIKTRHEKVDDFGKILKNVEAVMDPTVDPCENFYQFVCGRFTNKNLSSEDYANKEFKKRLISKYDQEKPLESENKLKIIKHSKNLYQFCKKTKNDKGFKDFILRDLEAIGGWPALKGDSWNKSAFDWKRPVFKTGNQNIWTNYLMNIQLFQSSDKIFLHIDRIFYNNKTALEFAVRLAGNNSIVKEELEKVDEFSKTFLKEYSLYSIADRNVENYASQTMEMTLENLIEKYPYYPWFEYLRYIEPNIQLNDTLIVPISTIIENLFSFLNNTDQRMLANIVAWNRVSHYDGFFARHNQIEDCFEITSEIFPTAPSLMYYHEFIHANKTIKAKQLVETISNKIRQQFIKMLENTDWISNKTYLIEKLEKLSYEFGYPSDLLKDNLRNERYDKLQLNQPNFYDAYISIFELNRRHRYDKSMIKHPVDLMEYFSELENLPEARYREKSNSILIRLALLQRLFLDINNPMWMNFAAIGSIIGHEIGQSLNLNLIQSNAKGELISWSKNSTSHIEYQKKIRCLNDMYKDIANVSSASLDYPYELHTTRDDVADNLGFKATNLAYKSSTIIENGRAFHQKEYSPNQLFWIYATNRFCKIHQPVTKTFQRNVIYHLYTHNSDELRILASLSNNHEFSRDFNCPENSPMNRQKKCALF